MAADDVDWDGLEGEDAPSALGSPSQALSAPSVNTPRTLPAHQGVDASLGSAEAGHADAMPQEPIVMEHSATTSLSTQGQSISVMSLESKWGRAAPRSPCSPNTGKAQSTPASRQNGRGLRGRARSAQGCRSEWQSSLFPYSLVRVARSSPCLLQREHDQGPLGAGTQEDCHRSVVAAPDG